MFKIFSLLLIFINIFESKLQFVVEVFRHGARYSFEEKEPINNGELTAVGQR